jgi:hypothetical protein
MLTEFLIFNGINKISFSQNFLTVISEYFFLSTFLIVWWGLLRLVTATTARVC